MLLLLYKLSVSIKHWCKCQKERWRRKYPLLQEIIRGDDELGEMDDKMFERYIAIGSYNFPLNCNSFLLESPIKSNRNFGLVFRNGEKEYIIDLFNGLFIKRYPRYWVINIDTLKDGYINIQRLAEFYKAVVHSNHDGGESLNSLISSWVDMKMGLETYVDRNSSGINGDWNILRWLKASYQYLQEHPDASDEAKLVFTCVLTMYKVRSPLVSEVEAVELGCEDEELFLTIKEGDSERKIVVSDLEMESRFDPGIHIHASFMTSEGTEYQDLDLDSEALQRLMSESRRWCRELSDSHEITKIEWHEEGAQIKRHWGETLVVWLYTIAAISFSILTPSLNLMNRDNITERLVDGFTIASILLISFFGLVKLTSEDPNAVRNRLAGIKVLKSMREVCRYCNVKEAMAKLLLDANGETVRWVSNYNTCAMDITCSGSIQFEQGCTPTEILGMGKMLLYNMGTEEMRLYDVVRQRCRRAKWRGASVVHVEEDIWFGDGPGPEDVVIRDDVVLESHGTICPSSQCQGAQCV